MSTETRHTDLCIFNLALYVLDVNACEIAWAEKPSLKRLHERVTHGVLGLPSDENHGPPPRADKTKSVIKGIPLRHRLSPPALDHI